MPAVSVVMPVRDGERFLVEAIRSILEQTVRDLELVVVDDGSVDATPELLAAAARTDSRVRVLRREREGITHALNAGFSAARAPLVARMDADDVALPDRLQRQLAFLAGAPEIAVVGGGLILVDEAGREVDRGPGPARLSMLVRNDLAHPTVVVRADAFREAGGYRLDGSEDYDLWLRIEEQHGLAALPDPVLRYRLHPGQFSLEKLERHARAALGARAAARARRRGEPDPLAGVECVDDALLRRLGVTQDDVEQSVTEDSVQWAAMLLRVGREPDARALLDVASRREGAPPRRALARRSSGLLAKRAARQGNVVESVRHAVAALTGSRP